MSAERVDTMVGGEQLPRRIANALAVAEHPDTRGEVISLREANLAERAVFGDVLEED